MPATAENADGRRRIAIGTRAATHDQQGGGEAMEYKRQDGGYVNTGYRGQDVRVARDGTIFVKPKSPQPPTRPTPRKPKKK
jgi:hypothetical protein